jgi:hypothetical protein
LLVDDALAVGGEGFEDLVSWLMLSNFSNFSARDMHGFRQLLVENISALMMTP